jgi:hypothetical protein
MGDILKQFEKNEKIESLKKDVLKDKTVKYNGRNYNIEYLERKDIDLCMKQIILMDRFLNENDKEKMITSVILKRKLRGQRSSARVYKTDPIRLFKGKKQEFTLSVRYEYKPGESLRADTKKMLDKPIKKMYKQESKESNNLWKTIYKKVKDL